MYTQESRAPDRSSEPVFVVGMNGSGTTMMLDHLSHHPELFGFRLETYILPYYLHNQGRYGDLSADGNYLALWNDMRAEYAFRRANAGRPFELPPDWAEMPRHAAAVFDRIMLNFAYRENKMRWCEKTPTYALHMTTLAEAFPGSRFIHMIRDGRDCAVSNHRRWGRHPGNTIYRWKQVVSEGRRQGRLLGERYLEVRYEDITESPRDYMQVVCAHLGVPYDEKVLQASRQRLRAAGEEAKRTIVKLDGKNTGYLSAAMAASLERFAGAYLASLGYTTQSTGDSDPGSLRKLWWFVHDSIAVLSRQLKNKLTVQKNMTWSLFLARWKAILRHIRMSPPETTLRRKDK